MTYSHSNGLTGNSSRISNVHVTPKWRQSFAWADAKLCVSGCKALRERMQSFAWTDAKLCVRVGLNWHWNVCPILDKIKGKKTHPMGHLAPGYFYWNIITTWVKTVNFISYKATSIISLWCSNDLLMLLVWGNHYQKVSEAKKTNNA